MALNIVRVNALPETVATSTIYLVKGSASDVVEITSTLIREHGIGTVGYFKETHTPRQRS